MIRDPATIKAKASTLNNHLFPFILSPSFKMAEPGFDLSLKVTVSLLNGILTMNSLLSF